jgi:hypothetical protein
MRYALSTIVVLTLLATSAMADEDAVVASIKKLGGKVTRDEKQPERPVVEVNLSYTPVTDADLKDLKEFKQLHRLLLDRTKVTDAGLKEIKELKQLQWLVLSRTAVTDAGLRDIKEFKQLQDLFLEDTKITDAGLKEIKELKQLGRLELRRTQVTDAGVKELREALPRCAIDGILGMLRKEGGR